MEVIKSSAIQPMIDEAKRYNPHFDVYKFVVVDSLKEATELLDKFEREYSGHISTHTHFYSIDQGDIKRIFKRAGFVYTVAL